ncbi:MAG: thioredoxin domain-containing protein [Desulfosarcina sp.]|jgi:protein-disulfide isomerase
MKKQYIVQLSGILLVLLFIAGVYVYKKHQDKRYGFLAQENASTFVRPYSQTLGSDDAKIYLVEFTDPACETCSAFHPFVKKLMAQHEGKIKLVIRYAPFHDGADFPVKILEASRKQGKFWETMDVLYGTQRYWTSHHVVQPQKMWRFLSMVGLDIEKLKVDMNDPEIEKIIQQDLADAKTLNVRKTPGFFVNGKPLSDFGYNQLRDLIESAIKENY